MDKFFAIKTRVIASLLWCIVIGGLLALTISIQGTNQILDLRFNPYAILSAATLVLNLGLIIFFVRRPARSEERIWFMVYLAALSVFAFGEMLQRLSATPSQALFWAVMSSASALFAPALYLFALAYTNHTERRFPGLTALVLIGSSLLLFFYSHTDTIFNVAHVKLYPWGYNAVPGAGISFALLWYDGLLLLALARFISFRRQTTNPVLRKQSLLFIYATLLPFLVGTFTDGVLPAAGITILPPLAITLFTPAAIMFIYGIRRYQLATVSPTLFANTILEIMQEAVIVTDGQFTALYQNPKAEDLLGYSLRGNHQLSFVNFLEPEYVKQFKDSFADPSIEKLTLEQLEAVSFSGNKIPISLHGSRQKQGDKDTWVFVLTDITREVQTRRVIEHEVKVRTKELNEARTYLVASINSLEQGFALINEKGSIELLNGKARHLLLQAFEEAKLMPPSDLIGQPLDLALSPHGWTGRLKKSASRTLAHKKSAYLAINTEDGSFYDVYLTPVKNEHAILGATIVIQDVTEAKILERSKDEFFSIASHELRTPLTAIRGNMSMARDYYGDQLKDVTLHDLIDDTHAASIRLIEIVNDFLDSSRLEQGKMLFNYGSVKVGPLVSSVTTDLQMLTQQRGNSIVVDTTLNKLPEVWADEARLRQILYNLVSNANKYSDHATITISGDVKGAEAIIRVADTGKGITPEGQKLLFHKFQQASDSLLTRDNTKGTGLGLYISRLLATSMHGNIELEHSEVGKGSTFIVTMPLAPAAATHHQGKSETQSAVLPH